LICFAAVCGVVLAAANECKDGEYWNGAACRSCHASCKTCFDKNSKSCETCFEEESRQGLKYGHLLSVDYCAKRCGRGRHTSANPKGGLKCRDCHMQCGPSGCAGHGPNDCTSCRNFMAPNGECVASCEKGFGSDDTGLCRPHDQVPILNWLRKIGASEQAIEVFAAKGISFREVEKMDHQALQDAGVVLSKDRDMIMEKIVTKMFKVRRNYERFVEDFLNDYMDQVPNLLTTDKHYTPGVDDEPDAEGEEMPEEAQEEEEEKERPVCPFETEDAFIAAFNSNPAVIEFKAKSCMTYTTSYLQCRDKVKDCNATVKIFLKKIAKIYHPDRFSRVHPGCDQDLVMLPFMSLTTQFNACKKEQKDNRRKDRVNSDL